MQLTVNGQPPIFVSGASVQQPPQESHNYNHLGPAGGQTVTRSGVPVRQLLQRAGVNPDDVSLLAVARPRGDFGYLYHADLADPPDFPDGPALVSIDGGSTRFFRPQRSTNDANASDDIATPDGQPLAVSVYTGRLLTLAATHSPAHAVVGQPVRFAATASCCALAGETLNYGWSFDDTSAPATGATVAHRFAAAGTYRVSVALTGSQGSVALPLTTTVAVGAARRASGRGAGGSGGRTSPLSGPSAGASHGGRAPTGSGSGSSTVTPRLNASPSPTSSTPPTAAPSTTAAQPTPARRPAAAPVARPAPSPPPARSPQPSATVTLLPVDGVVIAGPGAKLASLQPIAAPPAGAHASARAGRPAAGGAGVPLGIVVTVGIICAGALRERRRAPSRIA